MEKMISAANKEVKNLIWKFEDNYRKSLRLSSPYDWHVSLAVSLFKIMPSNKEISRSFGKVAEISLSWDSTKIRVLRILEENVIDLREIYTESELDFLKKNFVQIVDFCFDFYNHEKLVSSVATFAQPKELTETCVKIANFENGSEIYNPFSGLGSYALMAPHCHFTGEDISSYSWALSQISLFAHNVSTSITEGDSFNSLIKKDKLYDGVITTPPFGLKWNGKDEFEAIKCIIENKLKDNSKVVAVLPSAFLFSTSLHSTMFKDYLLASGYLRMVVTLPPRIFHPMTAISVCIIVAQKSWDEDVLLVDGTSFTKERKGKNRYALDCEKLVEAIQSENSNFCVHQHHLELLTTGLLAPTIYMQQKVDDDVELKRLGDLVHLSSSPLGVRATEFTEIRHITVQNLSIANYNCKIDIGSLEDGEFNPHHQLVEPNSIIMMPSDRGLRLGYIKEIPEGMGITCPGAAICFQINEESHIGFMPLLDQLASDYVSNQVSKLFVSFARGFLSWKVLSYVMIPMPTLAEQLRIALLSRLADNTKAEEKLEDAFNDYQAEIHSRKHAISQTLSSVSALWNTLNMFRKNNSGSIHDSDVVSKITNMTVADMFDGITHRLDTLLVQTDNLADVNYNWGKEEHITTDSFIHDYIERHKDFRFQFIQDNFEPVISRMNEFDEVENMFGIIFPKRALETVFDNIISNAISYGFIDNSRTDYKILFSEVVEDIDKYIIRISNNGSPLPENINPEDVFLYGYSTSLNAETHDGKEHHGLGGYDTRNILKKYGADVKIISSPDEEYTVTYVLTFTKTDLTYE